MKYNQIRRMDISNGTGIRVSIFTQGCPFHCNGCFNQETWDFDKGKEFTEKEKELILNLCNSEHISGLSVLGGEPLIERNLMCLNDLFSDLKRQFPKKTIWVWTGFLFENLTEKQLDILKNVDVLVDGQFDLTKKDFNLKYRGSSNQRVIDVKTSLLEHKIIEIVR